VDWRRLTLYSVLVHCVFFSLFLQYTLCTIFVLLLLLLLLIIIIIIIIIIVIIIVIISHLQHRSRRSAAVVVVAVLAYSCIYRLDRWRLNCCEKMSHMTVKRATTY